MLTIIKLYGSSPLGLSLLFLQFLTLNMFYMGHQLSNIHTSNQYGNPTFHDHQVRYSIYKFTYASPRIQQHLWCIIRQFCNLKTIFLCKNRTFPKVHEPIYLSILYLIWKDPIQKHHLKDIPTHWCCIFTIPFFHMVTQSSVTPFS